MSSVVPNGKRIYTVEMSRMTGWQSGNEVGYLAPLTEQAGWSVVRVTWLPINELMQDICQHDPCSSNEERQKERKKERTTVEEIYESLYERKTWRDRTGG